MQSQNIPKTEISWTSCTVQSFTECPGMGGEIRELTVLAAKLSAGGRRVFLVPYGASDALGAMGYALAAEEIVSERADCQPKRVTRDVRRIASQAAPKLGLSTEAPAKRIEVVCDWSGPAYGRTYASTEEAIILAARLEGLALDLIPAGPWQVS